MKPKNRIETYFKQREREARGKANGEGGPGCGYGYSFLGDSFVGDDGATQVDGAAISDAVQDDPEIFATTTVRSVHGWEIDVGVYLPQRAYDDFLPRLVALHGWGQTSISTPRWSYLDFLDMSQLIPACRAHEVELLLPQAPWRNWTRLRGDESRHTLAASVNDLALDEDGNTHHPAAWIAGFSDGGNMAQLAFTRAPNRWGGLILAGAKPIADLAHLAKKVTGKTIIIQRSSRDLFSRSGDVEAIVAAFAGRNNTLVLDHKSLTPYRVPLFKNHRWDSALNETIFQAAFANFQPQEDEL